MVALYPNKQENVLNQNKEWEFMFETSIFKKELGIRISSRVCSTYNIFFTVLSWSKHFRVAVILERKQKCTVLGISCNCKEDNMNKEIEKSTINLHIISRWESVNIHCQ
jgi:hypothetical protein